MWWEGQLGMFTSARVPIDDTIEYSNPFRGWSSYSCSSLYNWHFSSFSFSLCSWRYRRWEISPLTLFIQHTLSFYLTNERVNGVDSLNEIRKIRSIQTLLIIEYRYSMTCFPLGRRMIKKDQLQIGKLNKMSMAQTHEVRRRDGTTVIPSPSDNGQCTAAIDSTRDWKGNE